MTQEYPITPSEDLVQRMVGSGNYTSREIRAAMAMVVPPSEAEQAFATPWSSSTTNPSPITPPPELVTSLRNSAPHGIRDAGVTRELWLINQAHAAGVRQGRLVNEAELQRARDEELDACEKWIKDQGYHPEVVRDFRAARRPQPSDKELAQRILVENGVNLDGRMELDSDDIAILTRALGALPNG